MIHASPLITALMMVFTGIIAGCYLGSRKSVVLDIIAGIMGVFIILWILIMYKVI
jgi:hypothetical protein